MTDAETNNRLFAALREAEAAGEDRKADELRDRKADELRDDIARDNANLMRFALGPKLDDDDIASEAGLVMTRVIRTFDPSRAQFSTVLVCSLRRAPSHAARHARGRREVCSTDVERLGRGGGFGGAPVAVDDKDDPAESVADAEERRRDVTLLGNLLERLPERERDIVMNRYGFYGKRTIYEELGRKWGVSKSAIQEIERRTLSVLRIRMKMGK
jgi:RNA polymerase sigma factor (sigma-70 family)